MTFTHLDEGTAERAWREAAPWRAGRAWVLDRVSHLVVTAAHPDDETLGAGGVMAQASRRGIPITVIVASDGEASHPDSPTVTRDALAQWRRDEVGQALDVVAPDSARYFLGLPDGGLTGASELEAHIDRIVRERTAALGGSAPGDTVILSPWSLDRHPDHAAVAEASARVAAAHGLRGAAYPIWAWLWSDAEATDIAWPDTLVLDLTDDDRDRKRRAMARHVSQTGPLSDQPGDEAMLSDGFQQHFRRDVEVFVPYEGFDPARSDAAATGVAVSAEIGPSEVGPGEVGSGPGAERSLGAGFFDEFYSGVRDPWGFETRWYEERKRAITLAALPAARYAHVLELGSSIGVTTALLAERADRVVATDIAESALAVARERLAARDNVRFERLTLPTEWPGGRFDLVVVSEVGYYLSRDELDELIDRIVGSLQPDATVVTCHWRHPVAEYPLDGDVVTERFRARLRPGLDLLVTHTERDFVLDVFRTAPGRSVAQETGLVG